MALLHPLLTIALALGLVLGTGATPAAETQAGVRVWFSPDGGCTAAIVDHLARARTTILVQAYSFTSVPIAKALVEAHRRGVKVRVILDASQRGEKYSSADFLADAGIETLIDEAHAIAHNKVMILDGRQVITGSFNFTKAAEEKNAENLVLLSSPEVAGIYAANWSEHAKHAVAYVSHAQRAER